MCSRCGRRAPKTRAAFVLQACERTTVIAPGSEASSCARLVTFLDFDTLERMLLSEIGFPTKRPLHRIFAGWSLKQGGGKTVHNPPYRTLTLTSMTFAFVRRKD